MTSGQPKHYSDEEFERDMRWVAEIVGRSPTKDEYRNHGRFSTRSYIRRFGTWAGAHSAAGLQPREATNLGVDTGPSAKYSDLEWSDLQRAGDVA